MERTTAWVLLTINLLLLGSFTEGARGVGECSSINNALKGKGFTSYPMWGGGDEGGVKSSHTSCPISSGQRNADKTIKCCSHSMDSSVIHREMNSVFNSKWFGPKLTFNADAFKERKSSFDEKFKAMLNGAHTSFHAMFERTYGMLYIQHANVFHELFKTLEKYYEDGRDSLEAKLNEFFAILTRKMFEVLNAQYEFDNTYLSCATITINEKQGNDLHRQIVSSLRRSFVATRALSQGLLVGEKIISNLQKIQMDGPECLTPLALMLHCPVCAEQRAYKPCILLCTATTTKCLSSTLALTKPWLEYLTSLENIIDRLLGPYNIEAVVEPIHIKISEIIMNFQENGHDLSQSVFTHCGKPTLRSRVSRSISVSKRDTSPPIAMAARPGSHSPGARRKNQGGQRVDNSQAANSADKSIEKLLREIKSRIKKSKNLFEVLPKQVCNGISKDYSSQQCWNGTGIMKPEKLKGPEDLDGVVVDLKSMMGKGPPNPIVSEQILLLQLITDKLRNAFNGLDVQWVTEIDSDDFGGSGDGSGSGNFPTDDDDGEDENPDGRINFKPPIMSFPPNFTRPGFTPNRTPPPILNPLPGIGIEEDDVEIDTGEDDEDNGDGSLNLHINSGEKSGNGIRNKDKGQSGSPSEGNEDRSNSNSGIDFGIIQPQPPITPRRPSTPAPFPPTLPPQIPTSRAPKRKPPTDDVNKTVASNNNKLEGSAGKAIAVIKLFTPVFMSMLGKIFPF